MNKIFKNEKLMYMLCGAAAIIVGKKIVTAETTRKAAVNSIAKGMKIRDDAKNELHKGARFLYRHGTLSRNSLSRRFASRTWALVTTASGS